MWTVHAIEWQISQCFMRPDRTNWDQVMDYFLKVCKDFAWFSCEFYIHGMFWPLYLHSRVIPYTSLLHHEYNSIDCSHRTSTLKVTALCLRVFVVADISDLRVNLLFHMGVDDFHVAFSTISGIRSLTPDILLIVDSFHVTAKWLYFSCSWNQTKSAQHKIFCRTVMKYCVTPSVLDCKIFV